MLQHPPTQHLAKSKSSVKDKFALGPLGRHLVKSTLLPHQDCEKVEIQESRANRGIILFFFFLT